MWYNYFCQAVPGAEGRQYRISQGRWPSGRTLYGHRWLPEHQKWEIVVEEAKVVKCIYELYLKENLGSMKIPIQLNKEGKITRFGSKWRLSSVYRILTHPGYKGEHPSGIKMPSIIDEATWELAQLRSFVSKIGAGLDPLDFRGKQELLRTLIEKVLYNGQNIEIQTIIPPRGQLPPIHRGGLRG